MIESVWTGLAIGFFGSFHCIGMCGPIALALPHTSPSKLRLVTGRLLYNFGRVVTYAILGILAGLVGRVVNVVDLQQALSIILGVIILIAVLLPNRVIQRFIPADAVGGWWGKLRGAFGKLWGSQSMPSMFAIGFLNGFLPCGFVYVALAAALTAGNVTASGAFMILFGIGTIPAMLATSLFGPFVGLRTRRFINRLLPVGAAILAILLILRGLSLGIPYISPNLSSPGHHMSSSEPACH
jgi:sulfite exporter TauE/SafE